MGVIMAVGAVAGGVSAYGQYQQGQEQGKMYSKMGMNTDLQAAMYRQAAKQNIAFIEQSRDYNINAAQVDASMATQDVQDAAAKVEGSQIATSAAMGVGGGSVTTADLIEDSARAAKADEIAIRYNADSYSTNTRNEAGQQIWNVENDLANNTWALGVQKEQYMSASKNAKTAGNIQALGTILSTAASVGSMGMQYGSSWRSPTKQKTNVFEKKVSANADNDWVV